LVWLLKKADWHSELDEEQKKPVESPVNNDAFSMDDFTSKPEVSKPEEKKKPAWAKDRFVKRPTEQYLWDTHNNRYVGFNDLDESGRPSHIDNPVILPPTEEMMSPTGDELATIDTDEFKYLSELLITIVRGGVPKTEVDKLIKATPPKTVGDISVLAMELWRLAQQYGLSRDWLLKQLS